MLTDLLLAAASSTPGINLNMGDLGSPEGMTTLVKLALVMTVLAVIPSILVMFTCFVRLIIVFHFLRQAMGSQNLPPNQVLAALALMLTFFVMSPIAMQIYEEAVVPYQQGQIESDQALDAGLGPIKDWMLRNTRQSDLLLFAKMAGGERPASRADVPLTVIMPAFLISELKTAFQIGFLLFMPFLVIDLVVASVLLSMGMMMLPPVMISFPFKILLFVMVDGWALLVGSLVTSFR